MNINLSVKKTFHKGICMGISWQITFRNSYFFLIQQEQQTVLSCEFIRLLKGCQLHTCHSVKLPSILWLYTAIKKCSKGTFQHWEKKWIHFKVKIWVTGGTKIWSGIPSNWRIFESLWLDIESQIDNLTFNVESIWSKYSQITRNPRSNFSSASDSNF